MKLSKEEIALRLLEIGLQNKIIDLPVRERRDFILDRYRDILEKIQKGHQE